MDATAVVSRLMRRLYNTIGAPLVFRNPSTGAACTITAIDRSASATLDEKGLLVPAVKPCFTVLSSDLAALNIAPEKMVDSTVTFSGQSWRILTISNKPDPSWRVVNGQLKPAPNWQQLGEIMFTMMSAS